MTGETRPGADVMGEGLRPVSHPKGGYERVRFVDDDSRTKTVFLDSVRQTGVFVTGIEVDKEGDEVSGKGFDQRRRVIAKKTILKRTPMRMDKKYAQLVEDTHAWIDLGGGWRAAKAENEGPRGGRVAVFNLWHESEGEDVLTFEKLKAAQSWVQEHPVETQGMQI